jgi:ABC-type transporter Mla subunit MlaD
MDDFWIVLMALLVIVAPLCLAWVLLGWSERPRASGTGPRSTGKR